jgi:hypothetical protein
VQNTTTQPEHPTQDRNEQCTLVTQQQTPIDAFLDSITKPLPQPLITQRPRQYAINQGSDPPAKRHSSRLAQKAITNSGKGAIEIAQELLVKKLGDLAGANSAGTSSSIPDEVDLYAQHFARPIEKTKMDAIQDLIEHGAAIKVKRGNQGEDAVAPGLMA